MPLFAMLVQETIAEDNIRNPPTGLWKASNEEAAAMSKHHSMKSIGIPIRGKIVVVYWKGL